MLSSAADVLVSAGLALLGIIMAPLAWTIVSGVFVATVIFGLLLNLLKIPLFRRLEITS